MRPRSLTYSRQATRIGYLADLLCNVDVVLKMIVVIVPSGYLAVLVRVWDTKHENLNSGVCPLEKDLAGLPVNVEQRGQSTCQFRSRRDASSVGVEQHDPAKALFLVLIEGSFNDEPAQLHGQLRELVEMGKFRTASGLSFAFSGPQSGLGPGSCRCSLLRRHDSRSELLDSRLVLLFANQVAAVSGLKDHMRSKIPSCLSATIGGRWHELSRALEIDLLVWRREKLDRIMWLPASDNSYFPQIIDWKYCEGEGTFLAYIHMYLGLEATYLSTCL